MKIAKAELKDNEFEEVNGGMNIIVEEKDENPSRWESVMNLFKIKS